MMASIASWEEHHAIVTVLSHFSSAVVRHSRFTGKSEASVVGCVQFGFISISEFNIMWIHYSRVHSAGFETLDLSGPFAIEAGFIRASLHYVQDLTLVLNPCIVGKRHIR